MTLLNHIVLKAQEGQIKMYHSSDFCHLFPRSKTRDKLIMPHESEWKTNMWKNGVIACVHFCDHSLPDVQYTKLKSVKFLLEHGGKYNVWKQNYIEVANVCLPSDEVYGGKMENHLLFSVYYLLLPESIPPSTTGLKLLYPKLVPVFKALLLFHIGSPRSTPLPLPKCSKVYSKLTYFYRV